MALIGALIKEGQLEPTQEAVMAAITARGMDTESVVQQHSKTVNVNAPRTRSAAICSPFPPDQVDPSVNGLSSPDNGKTMAKPLAPIGGKDPADVAGIGAESVRQILAQLQRQQYELQVQGEYIRRLGNKIDFVIQTQHVRPQLETKSAQSGKGKKGKKGKPPSPQTQSQQTLTESFV